jgi:protocatechuate 3,4-dioxygenase beta subunit
MHRLATRRRALFAVGGIGAAGVAIAALGHKMAPPVRQARPHQVGGLFADPEETGGPFPADGSNRSDGPTSNALLSAGVVRTDMTRSFIGSAAVARGVPLDLELTLLAVDRGGTPLAGCAVYAWHCDAGGRYSLYGDAAAESWLRAVQVADDDGRVGFRTVYPGAYDGRYPHVHLEVHRSLDTLNKGSRPLLTTQLAMPADVSRRVYANTAIYPDSLHNLARTDLTRDMVFGDNSRGEIAQQTPGVRVVDGRMIARARIGLAG